MLLLLDILNYQDAFLCMTSLNVLCLLKFLRVEILYYILYILCSILICSLWPSGFSLKLPWYASYNDLQVKTDDYCLVELIIRREPTTIAKIQIKSTDQTCLEEFSEIFGNLFMGFIALTPWREIRQTYCFEIFF